MQATKNKRVNMKGGNKVDTKENFKNKSTKNKWVNMKGGNKVDTKENFKNKSKSFIFCLWLP
jgi:hypothetical protein